MQLFVSDIHLSPERPDQARQFIDFLHGPAADAESLNILGDLFDAWVGDDDLAEPFNARIVAALHRLTATVPVRLLHGNRDFLIGPGFAETTGVRLLDDPTLIDAYGTPTLLLHGDTLCTDDAAYQQVRAQVRQAQWRERFLALPLDERKRQAAVFREASERHKRGTTSEIMDVNCDAVSALLRAYSYPRIIHGHTHRPGRHVHEVDGRRCERWVLGDWYAAGSYLQCDEGGVRAIAIMRDG